MTFLIADACMHAALAQNFSSLVALPALCHGMSLNQSRAAAKATCKAKAKAKVKSTARATAKAKQRARVAVKNKRRGERRKMCMFVFCGIRKTCKKRGIHRGIRGGSGGDPGPKRGIRLPEVL